MDDLETRLHDELHSVVVGVQPSVALDERVPTRVRQRARRRSIALAGVGIASVIALVAGMALLDDDEPTALDTAGQPTGEPPLPGEWATTAPAPIEPRIAFASAWTGDELLVWGGYGNEIYGDGAAYDPSTDTWRMLPDAPIDPRQDSVSVWTGEEWWILGGQTDDGQDADGAAAYNPTTDSWRTLDQLGDSLQMWSATASSTTALWVNTELVLVSLMPGPATDSTTNSFAITADGDWRPLAYVGAEAAVDPDDGTGTLLMTGPGNGSNTSCTATCLWRVPLDGTDEELVTAVQGPTGPLVWADGWVVSASEAVNLGTGAIQDTPNPIDTGILRPVGAGEWVVAASSTGGATGDAPMWWQWSPGRGDSIGLPTPPDESPRYAGQAVWTGTEVIVWGGHSCEGECSPIGPVVGQRLRLAEEVPSSHAAPSLDVPSTAPATTAPPTTGAETPTTTQPGGVGATVKLEAAGWTFGECGGFCRNEVAFDADAVTFTTSDGTTQIVNTGQLTDHGHEMLTAALADLDLASLDESYGCPDCDDGGAAWVSVTDGNTTITSFYNFGDPPPELEALDSVARSVIEALAQCDEDSPTVEVANIDVNGDGSINDPCTSPD